MSENDYVKVLKEIRAKLVRGRRGAALNYSDDDNIDAEFMWYQRHIDALDRAIADEERLARASGANLSH